MIAALPPPMLEPLRPVAHVQHEAAIVPVRCAASRCVGLVSASGARRRVWLKVGQAALVTAPVSAGDRRVHVRYKLKGAPERRFTVKVTRRRDRATCGYAPIARIEQRAGSVRLLRVLDRTLYGQRVKRYVACRDGVAYDLAETQGDGSDGSAAEATFVSEQWAALEMSLYDHYGNDQRLICMVRMSDGYAVTQYFNQGQYPGDTIIARVERIAVSDSGAIVRGLRRDTINQIHVLDSAGARTLDSGPGVDPHSLSVTADTATWTRGGASQSAAVSGLPTHLVLEENGCSAADPIGYDIPASLRLHLRSRPIEAGDRVGLVIVNDENGRGFYGLPLRVHRWHDGKWVAAEKAIYGTRRPGFARIGLTVRAHDRAGPKAGPDLRDEIRLPKDLAPGLYRVTREVELSRRTYTLHATFRI